MIWRLAAAFALISGSCVAQTAATTSNAAVLRGLDKITGETTDFEIQRGQPLLFGRLEVALTECRYPKGGSPVQAHVLLTIRDIVADAPAFDGWMLASSPALNALDHPRYDIWVLRCNSN